MTTITGAVARDDTIKRLGGQGDNWYATWAADDSLLIALCDGGGFPGLPHKTYNSRLYRAHGHPETGIEFTDVAGYPQLWTPLGEPLIGDAALNRPPRYYGFGTLAVDGVIYQYLSTFDPKPMKNSNRPPGSTRFVGAKLIYSSDGGDTWYNQDGTTPVVWEDWDERAGSLVFFDEPDTAFSLFSILQMGKDYELNTDGYVYVYAPNGNDEGTMNQLVMFRVPKDKVLDRSAYEYFTELGDDGSALWSTRIEDRGVVYTFPTGWVNKGGHPYAWQPCVTYDPGLGVYLMANWATGPSEDLEWFGKESYLGLYQSPTPWGPWTQFYEDTAWGPGGDTAARCYQPQIAPNWFSDDGKSLWLIWTDFQTFKDEYEYLDKIVTRAKEGASDDELVELYIEIRPYYSFNVQKFELTTD